VVPQLSGVAHEVRLAGRVVGGVGGVEKGLQGYLGVDDDLLGPRQVDNHVGTEATLVALGVHLLVEIAVLEHPRHLHHPAQLHLTPSTPGGRRSQGGHQVPGLALQLLLGFGQLPDLRAQPRVGALAFELEQPQSCS
jgi:hypothetical protein